MGSSKFFTNKNTSNSLFEKFKGVIDGMVNLHNFNAVVGYFRSSGYFKIRNEIQKSGKLPTIKILVGINIDDIFRQHNKSMLFLAGDKEKKKLRSNIANILLTILKMLRILKILKKEYCC